MFQNPGSKFIPHCFVWRGRAPPGEKEMREGGVSWGVGLEGQGGKGSSRWGLGWGVRWGMRGDRGARAVAGLRWGLEKAVGEGLRGNVLGWV